jgi:hypothetical protein
MKKSNQKPIRKVRSKFNLNDTYYMLPNDTKEIDGVSFVWVVKSIGIRETPKLMRKDSLEFVKE